MTRRNLFQLLLVLIFGRKILPPVGMPPQMLAPPCLDAPEVNQEALQFFLEQSFDFVTRAPSSSAYITNLSVPEGY